MLYMCTVLVCCNKYSLTSLFTIIEIWITLKIQFSTLCNYVHTVVVVVTFSITHFCTCILPNICIVRDSCIICFIWVFWTSANVATYMYHVRVLKVLTSWSVASSQISCKSSKSIIKILSVRNKTSDSVPRNSLTNLVYIVVLHHVEPSPVCAPSCRFTAWVDELLRVLRDLQVGQYQRTMVSSKPAEGQVNGVVCLQ